MDFSEPLLHESRKIAYLLKELDSALAFLNIADTSSGPEMMQRNRRHAREAYDHALGLLAVVNPDPSKQKEIDQRLALVRERLKSQAVVVSRSAHGIRGNS